MATKIRHAEPPIEPSPEATPPRPRTPTTGSGASVEAPRPGAGPADRATPARAPRQADRPRRVRERQPVVGGLRDRGDPEGGRSGGRDPGLLGRDARHLRHPGRARDPALLLPADDQGLSERRWRVHRDEGQLRPPRGPTGRGSPPHRLRADRLGVRCRGRRSHHLRGTRALHLPGVALGRVHLVHRVGQPARRAGVRSDVRGAHLFLHRDDVPAPGRRAREVARRRPAPAAGARGRRRDHRRDQPVPDPACVRIRRRGRHRGRGDLQRCPGLQAPRVAERPDDADVDGQPARCDVPRTVLPRGPARRWCRRRRRP